MKIADAFAKEAGRLKFGALDCAKNAKYNDFCAKAGELKLAQDDARDDSECSTLVWDGFGVVEFSHASLFVPVDPDQVEVSHYPTLRAYHLPSVKESDQQKGGEMTRQSDRSLMNWIETKLKEDGITPTPPSLSAGTKPPTTAESRRPSTSVKVSSVVALSDATITNLAQEKEAIARLIDAE
eukprot:6235533-Amphidinium_carterae.1